MTQQAIIDALFCLPKPARVIQPSDCVPFNQDITPQVRAQGFDAAVLAPCHCAHCQHQWNCADRRNDEISGVVARNRRRLRGLASYDSLRIGDSLRWIDEAIGAAELSGVFAQAEACVSGVDAARMYPLYGMCAKLRAPVVLEFSTRERWLHHRPQVEVVAADFPQVDILLATPPRTDAAGIFHFLQRFPRVSFVLSPQELQQEPALCDSLEQDGRERFFFRAAPMNTRAAVEMAQSLPLSPEARHSYLFENAAKLFRFALPITD